MSWQEAHRLALHPSLARLGLDREWRAVTASAPAATPLNPLQTFDLEHLRTNSQPGDHFGDRIVLGRIAGTHRGVAGVVCLCPGRSDCQPTTDLLRAPVANQVLGERQQATPRKAGARSRVPAVRGGLQHQDINH
jgi:hypothetical protein